MLIVGTSSPFVFRFVVLQRVSSGISSVEYSVWHYYDERTRSYFMAPCSVKHWAWAWGSSGAPRKMINVEADRVLLMEIALASRYYPAPVSGLVNVWATYFTLSKGLGNLTIVKTAMD